MGKRLAITLGITIPLILIGGPIALAYGFCYDNSKPDVTYDANFNADQVANTIIYDSLNTTKQDKLIRFGVSESDINNLLHSAFAENEVVTKYIDAPYIKVDDKNKTVDFYLHAHVPMFATKLKLSTSLQYVQPTQTTPGGVLFTIKDVKIARLNAANIGLSLASKFISDQDLEAQLKSAGLNIKVSLKDRTLFYANDDLVNDVIKKSGIDNIYLSMVDFVLDNNLLDISCTKEKIGVNFNLTKLTDNQTYVDNSKSVNINPLMEKYVSDIETLLANSLITTNDVDLALDFLTSGYNNCEVETQNFIKNKDLSSIGINDVTSHKGFNINSTRNITDVFNKQINEIDPLTIIANQKLDISFSEDDLNETLKTSQIIGKSFNFVTKIDGKDKLNNIYIDDFYLNIFNGELDFVIGVNFNGLSTKLIIRSSAKQYDGSIVKLEISDILFGELTANEEIKKACIDFVMDALTNLTDWFRADGGNKLIFFDLNTCVNQISDPTIKTFLSSCTLTSKVSGTSLKENGKLNISFAK